MSDAGYTWGTGRRKSSVARVRIKKGTGTIEVNKQPYDKYFDNTKARAAVVRPLEELNISSRYDVIAQVNGGGKCGQAEAIVLGLSRALKIVDPALEPQLRSSGLLTRDPRMKERKKYGLHGARRGTQFSKR